MIIDHPKKEDIPALRALWKQAFSDTDDFLDTFFIYGFAEKRAMVAREEGQIRAALYWFDLRWEGRPLAYLYAVATDKAHRGRGICSALLHATHRHLMGKYWGTVLVPGEESLRAFYERFGYSSFGGMEEIPLAAGESPVFAQKLTPEEYMGRRAGMLPAGSIYQDGETLTFLQTQLDFYGGDGWLLAGRMEQETLYAPEFLGEVQNLPGILRALCGRQGRVMTPGQTPFAMYRSLQGEQEKPAYFAFALD